MRIVNHPSVRRASRVFIDNGCKPCRYVVRHVPESFHQWTTHMETMVIVGEDVVHEDFHHGDYFHTEEEAIASFDKRKR